MTVFVYAHTHQLETRWSLRLGLGSSVDVLNTGAFQRLIDESGFMSRVKAMKLENPSDGLSKIPLESLPPCYSFVMIPAGPGDGRPAAQTKIWRMREEDGQGGVLAVGDATCK